MATKKKVLVTRPPVNYDELKSILEPFDVVLGSPECFMDRGEMLAHLKTCHAVIAWSSDHINREAMSLGGSLEIVANFGAGYDTVDVDCAKEKGIIVTNTPGVLSDATADLAFALILNSTRRLFEAEKFLRAGRWPSEGNPILFNGLGLQGRVLGLVGMGKIGCEVALRARAFKMKVIYHNRTQLSATREAELGVEYVPSLEHLLKRSDVVSLHCPLTPDTTHLIDAPQLAMMKKGSYLVNTARGKVVNENALVDALESGHLAGAGLDVFEEEPKVHPRLIELDNVSLTPHVGSATLATRTAMHALAMNNVRRVLEGGNPLTPVY